jgi:His-Xaa-Ser system radical SAM maturase HxsC
MCSQPPKKGDDSWILHELHSALSLISSPPLSLGFTGGEPFTEAERFIGLVQHARDELPTTAIHVLTNGRAFAKSDIVSQWADLNHPNLCVGIPIYSAVDHIHDYVVQSLGAFDETVLGIMKLKNAGQRVEIRIVLNAITAARLEQTCAWIGRNVPFVDHVALMGLENTGFAIANDKLLWIDPMDYREALKRGVQILAAAGVNVSIYNLPLCVIDEEVREYSVKSISDWKNAFPPSCNTCAAKDRCAGFFSSGRTRITRGLRPLAA